MGQNVWGYRNRVRGGPGYDVGADSMGLMASFCTGESTIQSQNGKVVLATELHCFVN